MSRSIPKLPLALMASLGLFASATQAQTNTATSLRATPLPELPLRETLPQLTASPIFVAKLNDGKQTLRGFVDLHTHPMAHLGFGGNLVHGAPDVDVLMPAGQIYRDNACNQDPERAKSADQALGSCYSTHRGHDLIRNKCGNHIRAMVLDGLEDGNHAAKHTTDHPQGRPTFVNWPKHDDILHQQMWVDWVRRAHQGGMRVMVALAVNNYTLATGLETSTKNHRKDKASGDLQIKELKRFVGRHSEFMEIAYSAADVRRIVGDKDKLAVIVGVELDDIGDFVVDKVKPSPGAVRTELRRLHGLGVRYAFPVHLIDNHFAGTAAYENEANRANCFHYGDWWKLTCSNDAGKDEAGIRKKVGAGNDYAVMMKLGGCGGTAPVPTCDHKKQGHRNKRDLQPIGEELIKEMMRLGMIIDVDHASLASMNDIMTLTGAQPGGAYPVVSGHNSLRDADHADENGRTKAQYQEIARRKGIAGVGWGALRSNEWLGKLAGVEQTGVALALGSDINGLVAQPRQRSGCDKAHPCVEYSDSFPKAKWGEKTWNYNSEGVAHIGLFPDVLRDIEGQPGGQELVDTLFDGAEGFAVMWERAEKVGKSVPPPVTTNAMTITGAEYGKNCGIASPKSTFTKWVTQQCADLSKCDFTFTFTPWGGDPNPSMCTKEIDISYKCGATAKRKKVMHEKTPQTVPLSCP